MKHYCNPGFNIILVCEVAVMVHTLCIGTWELNLLTVEVLGDLQVKNSSALQQLQKKVGWIRGPGCSSVSDPVWRKVLAASKNGCWDPFLHAEIKVPIGCAGTFTKKSGLSLWGGWESVSTCQASHQRDAGTAWICSTSAISASCARGGDLV